MFKVRVVNFIEYGTLSSNVIMIYLILYKNSQEIRLPIIRELVLLLEK